MKQSKRLVPALAIGLAVAAVSAFPVSSHVLAAHNGAPHRAAMTGKVGFLFSDFTTSARWQFDKADFIAALHKIDPGVQVLVTDAKAAQTTQQNQAKSLLTRGVKVLLDVPVDSAQAAAIVRAAHANHPKVKVIAYDRLITGIREDAYASFNGFNVGVEQGNYIKAHVKKGGTIIEIAGSPTDNNAHLFHNGAMSVLQPLISSGYYKLGYNIFTPNWDDATAQKECASALNKLNNKIDGVLVANDGMAVACINALKAQKLNGKIPITGQDATVAGLQQVLLGNQSMSVYKPVKGLATAAAQITDKFLRGKAFMAKVQTDTQGGGKTPTVLLGVIAVTKSNMKATVLKDKWVSRADLCNGIAAACTAAGI